MVFSSLFAVVAVYLTATESMNVYDVLMMATGTVALYVYLAIACSQLRMRKKYQREGKQIDFKMWLFPWITYAVIFIIIGSLLVMLIEGTYFKEVIYTSLLALSIVMIGVLVQKLNKAKVSNNALIQKKQSI